MSNTPTSTPPSSPPLSPEASSWIAIAPAVFVLLWSTGFIGARYSIPYAEPFTFLAYRFLIVSAALFIFSFVIKARWPKSFSAAFHTAIAGLLLHGCYLGGVFFAIEQGMQTAVSAIIVSSQPILVAIAAGPFLGEKITARQWLGFFLGFGGVILIVADGLSLNNLTLVSVTAALIGLFGITMGTLYQKRYCTKMDLCTGSSIQFGAAGIAMAIFSGAFETGDIIWGKELVLTMAWMVIVLSFGAVTLLYILISRGAASKVSSLFFLVPPMVAIESWLLFDEILTMVDLIGLTITMVAVVLVMHKPKTEPAK